MKRHAVDLQPLLCCITCQKTDLMSWSSIWTWSLRMEREQGWRVEGTYWYLMEGFLSTETLEANVWIKNLWFSCQECEQFQSNCQPHQEGGGCANVCMCIHACAHTCICDYRKFMRCRTEIYKAKPAESIISYIATLMYQMTVCRPYAVRPMCCLRAECAFIHFGCLWVNIWLGLWLFQICKEEENA